MKSTQRFELEISENAFICIEDESRTYIWEWKTMDPELLDTFMAIRQEVREIIKRALSSDAKAGFGFVAEDIGNYEDPSPATLCRAFKYPPG
jgi:hypothetical protein